MKKDMSQLAAHQFQKEYNKIIAEHPFSKIASHLLKEVSSEEDEDYGDYAESLLNGDIELADATPPITTGTHESEEKQPGTATTGPTPTPAPTTDSTQPTGQDPQKTASMLNILVKASAICDSFGVETVATQILRIAAAVAKKLPKGKNKKK
jgi:heme-binding NEAT domain protein